MTDVFISFLLAKLYEILTIEWFHNFKTFAAHNYEMSAYQSTHHNLLSK